MKTHAKVIAEKTTAIATVHAHLLHKLEWIGCSILCASTASGIHYVEFGASLVLSVVYAALLLVRDAK